MKCQRCEKQATFHITELEGGKHQELHLCEEHAKQYLTQGESEASGASSLTGALAQQLAVSQTAAQILCIPTGTDCVAARRETLPRAEGQSRKSQRPSTKSIDAFILLKIPHCGVRRRQDRSSRLT